MLLMNVLNPVPNPTWEGAEELKSLCERQASADMFQALPERLDLGSDGILLIG